jgi:hypothetical protein
MTLNHFWFLGPPLLLLISFPLAIFAAITTSVAFGVLLIRVLIVYFELGIALVQSWLFARASSPQLPLRPRYSPRSPSRTSPSRHRTRGSSVGSNASSQTETAVTLTQRRPSKSVSAASFAGTGDENRDFEGVGGWRLSSGDGDDDALWIGMNSRLELPAVPTDTRRHHRSLTAGSGIGAAPSAGVVQGQEQRWSWSPEGLRMSPMLGRMARDGRDAVQTSGDAEEYFPVQPHLRSTNLAIDSVSKVAQSEPRRKSLSSSSANSSGSVKEVKRRSQPGSR